MFLKILRERYSSTVIFKEVVSSRKEQPELQKLMENIKKGDTLVVCELSRLARNFSTLIQLGEELKKKDVRLISMKENIDTENKLIGPLLFNLIACFYEFERDIIRERTLKALESKRKRGLNGGRPPVPANKIKRALEDYDKMTIPVSEILSTYNISRASFYRYIKKRRGLLENLSALAKEINVNSLVRLDVKIIEDCNMSMDEIDQQHRFLKNKGESVWTIVNSQSGITSYTGFFGGRVRALSCNLIKRKV